jgi:chromosome segregation ATPase
MAVNERDRHQLYETARRELGEAEADYLMAALPPVGWADIATKHDLRELEGRLDGRLGGRISSLVGRIDALGGRIDGLEGRIDGLEGRIDGLGGRIDGLEGRIDGMDARISGLETRIGGLEQRVTGLDDALRSATTRVTTLMVGQTVAIMSMIGLVAA